MSEQGTNNPIANVDVGESQGLSVSKLVELARQGYEQKRTKNCLDLTRAILLIDPENAEAQLMRSSIRSEMHRDLENARALVRDAPLTEKPEICSQAGGTTSQQTPDLESLDAGAEESATPIQETNLSSTIAAAPAVSEQPPWAPEPNEFFGATIPTKKRRQLKGVKRGSAMILVVLVVAAWPIFRSKSNSVQVPVSLAASAGSVPTLDVHKVAADGQSIGTLRTDSLPGPAVGGDLDARITDSPLITAHPPAASVVVTPRPLLKPSEEPVVLSGSGTLAISSPTSTEIYIDDEYVGSTPVSLQMSAGMHTIEYRHGDLRKTLTHVIKESETTRATIAFEVAVSINANPWADVFLDGIERKPLGQTPLSDVRVPIGSVLVFENPKFQAKKYRVTGNETGIRITFQ